MSVPTIASRKDRSTLRKNRWAVIADHYVSLDLTHEDARAEAQELRERKQPGIVITTSQAAKRISNGELTQLKAA